MNTRKIIQRITVINLMLLALSMSVYANPIHSYHRNFNLPIPADRNKSNGSMNDAVININKHHIIYDIDVGITVTHTNVFDLQLILQSPSGTSLVLNIGDPYNGFFEGENYIDTIFDDEALVIIEDGQAPFSGRFKPVSGSLLEIFDGQDAFGVWRLRILDVYEYDTGTLKSVELILTTPESASVILLAFGTILAGRFRTVPRRKR